MPMHATPGTGPKRYYAATVDGFSRLLAVTPLGARHFYEMIFAVLRHEQKWRVLAVPQLPATGRCCALHLKA